MSAGRPKVYLLSSPVKSNRANARIPVVMGRRMVCDCSLLIINILYAEDKMNIIDVNRKLPLMG